ncbi:MAG: (deoxy)nucleoside triphosphate pyrophosphohydrolase [Clostridiales bacterium]|nr:(deoxy)nucleoside triphosphate pyrophosphohydrolase [Clostridiales bacterium]
MKTIEVAAGVVRDEHGRVLICQRIGSLDGLWEFPGGKREASESFAQCLERELMEELDLPITPVGELAQVQHSDGQKQILLVFVAAKALAAAPLALRVHADAQWVRPKDLERYTFCPADQTFVAMKLIQ